MDATTAPHRIPPEMPQYGETNHIFEMMQNMLQQLLIHQPEDPIPFMIKYFQEDNDNVPKIIILGPPASGKTTIAMWLSKHLKSVFLSLENLMTKEYSSLAERARKHYQKMKSLPPLLLVKLIQERLGEDDCLRRGWILDGIPETREQVLMIQALGITPRHVIVLSAPDTVLIERNLGKRVDPHNGEIYHTTFDWPPEFEIQNRLIVPEGISEKETAQRLMAYHRSIVRVLPSYPKTLKVISADQPCVDVFYQGWPSLRCRAHEAVKTPRAPKPLGSLPCVSSEISAGEASFAGEAVLGPRAGPTYPCTCVSGAALARAWRWHRNRSRVQKPMLLCSLPGSWVAHGFPAVPPLRRIFSSKHCTLKRNNQKIPLMP